MSAWLSEAQEGARILERAEHSSLQAAEGWAREFAERAAGRAGSEGFVLVWAEGVAVDGWGWDLEGAYVVSEEFLALMAPEAPGGEA